MTDYSNMSRCDAVERCIGLEIEVKKMTKAMERIAAFEGEAVAYLHDVVCPIDQEPDQALSFSPDSFPMGEELGFRSVGCRPLYAGPPLCPSASDVTGLVAVPFEPTDQQWGGLARHLMMWLDFGDPTVNRLRGHLKMLGVEIPAWLENESEFQRESVPSKGSRVTWIYKAMLDDYRKEVKS